MVDGNARSLFAKTLAERKERVMSYIFCRPEIALLQPPHLRDASLHYLRLSGKSLRPAILLFACGAAGGDEQTALPAAAAVEVYHTWTLVHDDIIDRDVKRRGQTTVHEEFRRRAETELRYPPAEAAHYGVSIAILAGDVMQGWCASILSDLALQPGCDPRLVLYLVKDLMMDTQARLAAGQTLDVQFEQTPVEEVDEADILDMLSGKTSALLEFCGRAGTLIGLNAVEPEHPQVRALASFARFCGLAFQLQDDVLGVVGDETRLGKTVGSDIREGKKTLIIYHALRHADARRRAAILKALGSSAASPAEVQGAVAALAELGSITYVQDKALAYVHQAMACLQDIPPSPYKDLLLAWANQMVDRSS
ncbi:MAG: polyprenyl synthetase family protein [Chloroflexi bacterium]|nr:polyprenyl synthetase family protein [Chloroflexota bacterium]